MVSGARTFSLEDTFLEPQVLDPPPTRHALFLLLLALAGLLHLGTAGWSDLYDGAEGQFAGGAREMLEAGNWLLPTNNGVPILEHPPLLHWLTILSYKAFGVSVMAARVPIALAIVASVALTFLIGERLAGYWRGFAAGLIHLCCAGTFIVGRIVSPDPIFGAFVAGTIFCAICGYQRRRNRGAWFTGVWVCLSFACLSKGLAGFFYLAAIFLLLALIFREARLRFRLLLHWPYWLIFILIVAPWFIWAHRHLPGFITQSLGWPNDPGSSRLQFLALHLAWWFPAVILVLPGLLFATRRIIRPNEIAFADALPVCWMIVGFLPLLLREHPPASTSMSMWSAFALVAALAWDRTPQRLRTLALVLLAAAGAGMASIALYAPQLCAEFIPPDIPIASWVGLRRMFGIACLALAIFALVAIYLGSRHRSEIALSLVLLSMVPLGFCLAEGVSRAASHFSLAKAAQFLNPRMGVNGQVLFEGPLRSASTLTFYLNRDFFLVNQRPDSFEQNEAAQRKYLDEAFVLEAWHRADPLYLIIHDDRVPHWQKLVTERVHIFHLVTTCGPYVVLTNQL